MNYIQLLSEDKSLITYRPSLRKACGSITGTILFQQILYWWSKNSSEPFFKFKEPCSHDSYKEGDSWCEELAFSSREFDSAIKSIGLKIRKSQLSSIEEGNGSMVYYWTDTSRKTWYLVDELAVKKALSVIYVNAETADRKTTKPQLAKRQNRSYQNAETAVIINTETTKDYQETTTESKDTHTFEKSNPSSVQENPNQETLAEPKKKEKKVPAKKEKVNYGIVQFPEHLKQPEFMEAWSEYKDYRKAGRTKDGKKFWFASAKSENRKLAEIGNIFNNSKEAAACVLRNIDNGWCGYFKKEESRGLPAQRKKAAAPSNLDGVTSENFWDAA